MEPKRTAERRSRGKRNNVIHTKSCHLGGYVIRRHDAVRDSAHQKTTASFKDAETEPELKLVEDQSLKQGVNKTIEARTDVRITSL